MPARFSAFGRVFSPSWPMTLATVTLLGIFVSLGRWQWQRGEAKQDVWAEYRRDAAATPLSGSALADLPRFTRVEITGRFMPARQFLLDNRPHAGRPGYEVLTPFELEDGRWVLVNRGWVPFTGYQDQLPDVSFAAQDRLTLTGKVEELPVAGLQSGRSPPRQTASWPRLTSFPTHEELESTLEREIEPRIVLLDPSLPQGYVRDWKPPGLDPSRHFSYAIQWWGFAVVLLVLYFALNFRPEDRPENRRVS
jgi:surfeit locus 1 family protein